MTIENPDETPSPEPPRRDPEAPRSSGGNDIAEKFRATSVGEKIILAAALLLLIASFLPWYSFDLGVAGVSIDRSGWQSPGALWSMLAVLVGLAMATVILVKLFASAGTLPDNVGGITWPKIMLGAGVFAVLLILIKLVNESSYMAIGFFLGIICVIALAVGGFFMFREEQGNPIM